MTAGKSHELKQRREELTQALPGLSQKRDQTYRLNSDAVALDRAGVKRQAPGDMAQLKENETAADVAIRDCQRELRQLDAEIESASGSGFGVKFGRAVSRVRGDD